MVDPYPLEDLFLALRRRGLTVGWRDYRDALKSIGAGFGIGTRADLLRLLQILWARTDHEARTVEQLFREIGSPGKDEIAKYSRTVRGPQSTGVKTETQGQPEVPASPPDRDRALSPAFLTGDQRGVRIPQAALPRLASEAFVLTPQFPVTVRSLTIVWRRFRKRIREGRGVELDVASTIEQQCRSGRLLTPILRPERKNQARLVLLIDVSQSMAAWSALTPLLKQSMEQGHLGSARVYYFSNVPSDVLYAQPNLHDPFYLTEAVHRQPSAALMIFSDAGAARGTRNRRRLEETKRFFDDTGLAWRPVAWINPLPATRWPGTTAHSLARLPKVNMLPLSDASLVRAIDLLRGARSI